MERNQLTEHLVMKSLLEDKYFPTHSSSIEVKGKDEKNLSEKEVLFHLCLLQDLGYAAPVGPSYWRLTLAGHAAVEKHHPDYSKNLYAKVGKG